MSRLLLIGIAMAVLSGNLYGQKESFPTIYNNLGWTTEASELTNLYFFPSIAYSLQTNSYDLWEFELQNVNYYQSEDNQDFNSNFEFITRVTYFSIIPGFENKSFKPYFGWGFSPFYAHTKYSSPNRSINEWGLFLFVATPRVSVALSENISFNLATPLNLMKVTAAFSERKDLAGMKINEPNYESVFFPKIFEFKGGVSFHIRPDKK